MGKKILLFIPFLLSCIDIKAPPEKLPYYAIYSYMLLNEKIQEVFLVPIKPIEGEITYPGIMRVEMIGEQDTVIFIRSTKDSLFFYDTTANIWLQGGKDYKLMIRLKNKDSIYSVSHSPTLFTVIYPDYNDTLFLDDSLNARIIWSESKGSYIYSVIFIPEGRDTLYSFPVQDTVLDLYLLNKISKIEEGEYLIKIFAIDENIYEWEISKYSNVVNGEGVFGISARETTRIYIKSNR